MRDGILARTRVDVDIVLANLDRKSLQVVGELVERAARAEVEAGVMPVAGENPVRDGPAMQRKPHVGAAVVDGVDGVAVGEQAHRVPADSDDEAPCGSELG